MSLQRILLMVTGLALGAAPATAQDRGVVLQVLAGGYSHLANLNSSGPAAHFQTGYNLGGGIGVQLNEYAAIRSDFTFAQTEGRGSVPFVNAKVNRYFVGGHVELRFPLSGFSPFLFAGAGAVVIDQRGPESREQFDHFSGPAGIFGGGLSLEVPDSRFSILAEGRVLTYKWTAPPYYRTQWDLSYSVGLAYHFGS